MVKGYLEYIKEHFGAITIEYPPEHIFIRNPSEPKPLGLNSWVGGTGRIPMHWNNSPYLSGGFGGSGYGRFGQDPDEEGWADINTRADASFDKKMDALNLISTKLMEVSDKVPYTAIANEIMQDIDSGKLDLEDGDSGDSEKLNLIGIPVFSKTFETPTEGSPGTYFDPPDPGDSGEYETFIAEPKDSNFYKIFGVNSMKDIPSIDDTIDRYFANHKLIYPVFVSLGKGGIKLLSLLDRMAQGISNQLDSSYQEFDENYFDGGRTSFEDEELYDALDVEHYGLFKFLSKLGSHNPRDIRLSVNHRDGVKEIMTNNSPSDMAMKKNNIKSVIGDVINVPDLLKNT